ncbi:hypothetical protein ACIRVK_13670 [Streptomyces sp. NPDC101152]|uniref:hypothetical protein n=1 Tax=Streptomyces sp. NPDC101152 TaxID=3366116 RepID=UPI003815978B
MPGETISVRALQAAVALVTAQAAGIVVSQEQLIGDVPADEVVVVLTALCAASLGAAVPSADPGALLRTTGVMAARLEADQL